MTTHLKTCLFISIFAGSVFTSLILPSHGMEDRENRGEEETKKQRFSLRDLLKGEPEKGFNSLALYEKKFQQKKEKQVADEKKLGPPERKIPGMVEGETETKILKELMEEISDMPLERLLEEGEKYIIDLRKGLALSGRYEGEKNSSVEEKIKTVIEDLPLHETNAATREEFAQNLPQVIPIPEEFEEEKKEQSTIISNKEDQTNAIPEKINSSLPKSAIIAAHKILFECILNETNQKVIRSIGYIGAIAYLCKITGVNREVVYYFENNLGGFIPDTVREVLSKLVLSKLI